MERRAAWGNDFWSGRAPQNAASPSLVSTRLVRVDRALAGVGAWRRRGASSARGSHRVRALYRTYDRTHLPEINGRSEQAGIAKAWRGHGARQLERTRLLRGTIDMIGGGAGNRCPG